MRILVLNWRDIRSSRGGGAERVTHEVAKRLVVRGHEVTWFSSSEQGLAADETVEGVRIVRRGSELTTRLHAPRVARRCAPDVVLEEINTLPYLAPLWSPVPVLLYMNQLAREVWWHEAALPVAAVGWTLEPWYLRLYRGCDAVAISQSTLADLRALGIGRRATIAPMAVEAAPIASLADPPLTGRLIAIGRLTSSKRYDHAVRALALLRRRKPAATLTVIGRGREESRLRSLAHELGVGDAVELRGNVSEAEKIALLDSSDVLVGTSVREGWGLTVTEAAARGVPAVVYDIAGFRDAVVPGRTGVLVEPRPDALATAVADLLDAPPTYRSLAKNALRSVRSLTYEATTNAFEEALTRANSSRG